MEVLDKIRQVISVVKKPSWVRGVPRNFGSKAAGTPKADEWRMLFTVYLPLALVQLWGHYPRQDRRWQILNHTMHLVIAITIICRRTMTIDLAEQYRHHITAYVRDLAVLHPSVAAVPNMHMAFHIYDFLMLFGPVRSWWTFPFERLVGLAQRLISNHIYGAIITIHIYYVG
jgi:hypothetical protein